MLDLTRSGLGAPTAGITAPVAAVGGPLAYQVVAVPVASAPLRGGHRLPLAGEATGAGYARCARVVSHWWWSRPKSCARSTARSTEPTTPVSPRYELLARLAACILTERQSATSPIRSSSVQAARQASPNYSSPGDCSSEPHPHTTAGFRSSRLALRPANRAEAGSERGRTTLSADHGRRYELTAGRGSGAGDRARNLVDVVSEMPVADEALGAWLGRSAARLWLEERTRFLRGAARHQVVGSDGIGAQVVVTLDCLFFGGG
jgi:hypothetical protein